jgi:hypothetical protein
VHQLLNLSSNEIDKILTFVKYVLTEEKTADYKKIIKERVKQDYELRLKELEKLYKDEL